MRSSDPYDTNNPVSMAARGETGADSPEQVSTSPSEGEVAQLNARIAELEAGLTSLQRRRARMPISSTWLV